MLRQLVAIITFAPHFWLTLREVAIDSIVSRHAPHVLLEVKNNANNYLFSNVYATTWLARLIRQIGRPFYYNM